MALILISSLLVGSVALTSGRAGASSADRSVHGAFKLRLISGRSCSSPVNLCARGELRGSIRGPAELVVQSIAPAGTRGLSLVMSTFVAHTRDGDLSFSSWAVADLAGSGDGPFTSVDLVTGGTGKWAGASGYLQSRGFVTKTSDTGDYLGRITLP